MHATSTMMVTPHLPASFGPTIGFANAATVAFSLFFLAVFLVALYSFIAIYHWMRYGHTSPLAIPAITVHIFVSVALVLFAASGLF